MRKERAAERVTFGAVKPALPFRSINRAGSTGHDPNLQRHHLLPIQLLNTSCFETMFSEIGPRKIGFNDFRVNGILLPCREQTAIRLCLPMHRGPHRHYNEMVMTRAGSIERQWSHSHKDTPDRAAVDALASLALLQKALRKRLLSQQRRLILNKNDPVGTGFDFEELDAMAGALWDAT